MNRVRWLARKGLGKSLNRWKSVRGCRNPDQW